MRSSHPSFRKRGRTAKRSTEPRDARGAASGRRIAVAFPHNVLSFQTETSPSPPACDHDVMGGRKKKEKKKVKTRPLFPKPVLKKRNQGKKSKVGNDARF